MDAPRLGGATSRPVLWSIKQLSSLPLVFPIYICVVWYLCTNVPEGQMTTAHKMKWPCRANRT
jgi:hypothetical protein